MVTVASETRIPLRQAAKLVHTVGSDYAVNLDGANAALMCGPRGYNGNYTAKKMTTNEINTTYYALQSEHTAPK